MSMTKILSFSLMIVIALLASACGALGPQAEATMDPQIFQQTLNAASTQALETIVAQLTATAQAQPPEPTQQPTVVVFTPTTQPTATATATVTNTLPPPTATRVPATATATHTATPSDLQCSIVSQSPALGEKMKMGNDFDAVWKLKNTGTKLWDAGEADIRFSSGSKLQKFGDIYDLAKTVNPGEEISIAVDMLAPNIVGTYKATWVLVGEGKTICTMNVHIEVQE